MSAQLDMFAPPAREVVRTPFPTMVAAIAARDSGRRPKGEPTCATCGLTWGEICDQPDFRWRDEGRTAISRCWRCFAEVCHRCWLRADDGDALCPSCFALDAPPDDAECAGHFYAHNGAEWVRSGVAWRYGEPRGQACEYDPGRVWYWRVCDTWDITDAERNRRFRIVYDHLRGAADDASWAPAWLIGDRDDEAAA